jgi:hypothetical protein
MSGSTERKRVVWDESNLTDNEEYRKLHPVTMKIDEPKTPFHHDEGQYVDDDTAEEGAEEARGTWDPKVNDLARRVKQETPLVREEVHHATTPPQGAIAKGAKRPSLVVQSEPDALAGSQRLDERQHEAEFRAMRKAVYADEGAKFKQLLHSTVDDDDDTESSSANT